MKPVKGHDMKITPYDRRQEMRCVKGHDIEIILYDGRAHKFPHTGEIPGAGTNTLHVQEGFVQINHIYGSIGFPTDSVKQYTCTNVWEDEPEDQCDSSQGGGVPKE